MNAEKTTSATAALPVWVVALIALWGCAGPPVIPPASRAPEPATHPAQALPLDRPAPPATPLPAPERPEPRERPADPRSEPTPRMVAALHLTGQAQALLEAGRPDEAIRTLERALNLNPSSGANFYYLAEAWLMKGNLPQARMFHRLAARHLAKDTDFLTRVAGQAERIQRTADAQR